MESAFNWISDISGFRFISIKDKAIRVKSTLESYFKQFHCELKSYQKREIIHLVETTNVSIEEIIRRIAQYTISKEDSIYGIEWRVKEIFQDIDIISRDDNWFCEFSSLDGFHISKSKWATLISNYIGIGIKRYQMKPISNASELANLIVSLKTFTQGNEEKNTGSESLNKTDSKSKIEKELVSIVEFCQKQLDDLQSTTFKHPQLTDLRNQYISQLRTIIEEFMNLTNLIRNEIIWDHLVVAFFGETNAGKSTLIETLRLNYGVADTNSWKHSEIVGDGQADYTKDATEYDIVINGKRVTLIDVPGIEGDEAKYAEVIEKALRKAHVVFYVQGKNKKPDAKIAQKIGRYLSDWSRVYSIYNVRNSLDDYDPEMLNSVPDSLKTERNTDLQEQIQEVLKGILGNVYQGGLMLHGLVGLSVSSNFDHNAKWHNLHTQSLRIFGSSDKALEFSNIAEWISLMNECSDDFENVIIKSNRQKIIGLKIKGMNMLKSVEKTQSSSVENLTNRLYTLKNSVISLFGNAVRNAKQRPVTVAGQILNKLKSELVNIVNSESDTKQKVRRANSLATNAKYKLNSEIENELLENADTLKRNLKKQFSEFKDISLRMPTLPEVTVSELDLDIEDAFENLEVSFADVCTTFSSMAGSAAAGFAIGSIFPGIGNLVGLAAGAIVGAVGRGVMSDGGRADTVQAIGKEIEICKESATERIKQSISNIVSGLQDSQRRATKIIDNELASINDLAESLNIIYQKFTLH